VEVEFTQPILAFVLFEFNSMNECVDILKRLVTIAHHDLYIPCANHDESYAFYFEHWAKHYQYSKPPLKRPEGFWE
jgi:hypothetical protein